MLSPGSVLCKNRSLGYENLKRWKGEKSQAYELLVQKLKQTTKVKVKVRQSNTNTYIQHTYIHTYMYMIKYIILYLYYYL